MSTVTSIEDQMNEDEWALIQILAQPVLFREFINEGVESWEPLEAHERAWSTCDNTYIAMCCGRGVHKTTSMIEMLYFWMINNMFIPGDPGLFVMVPNKAQKDLAFSKIRSACLSHWMIKQFVLPNSINITDGRIEFKNGFIFWMRIAGAAGTDNNVIGVHTIRIWVDEAQEFPWHTWQSLQNCLRVEIPGHQLITSGVPNGNRKDNVLYHTDQEAKGYVSFNVAQTMMSFWTPEMEYKAREKYRAIHEDTEDYKHFVLGQHGVPSFNVFDRNRFVKIPSSEFSTIKDVYSQMMFEKVKTLDSIGKDVDGNTVYKANYHVEDVVICPPIPFSAGASPRIGLGYDVGFSPDPTVFFIMYEHTPGHWRNLIRIVLERVEYPIQREVLAWLDRVYGFNFIGIDMGGPGKVQYQDLTGESNDFQSNKFKTRLYPVEFGGYIVVAMLDDGTEKKDQQKKVAVENLSRWVFEGVFEFSEDDDDLMEELERTKFTRTITGEPVYRTDNDHQMAAFMCAIEAFNNNYGTPLGLRKGIQKKLLGAEWLRNDMFER